MFFYTNLHMSQQQALFVQQLEYIQYWKSYWQGCQLDFISRGKYNK